MRIEKLDESTKKNLLEDLLKRSPNSYGKYEQSVKEILDDVREKKDQALFDYTEKFDGVRLDGSSIQVTEEEIKEAYDAIMLGNCSKAIEAATKFIEKNPKVWNGFFLRAWALRKDGRYSDAKKDLLECIKLGESSSDIYNELSICELEEGNRELAKTYLESAADLDPENLTVLSNLAYLYLGDGQLDEAREYLEKARYISGDDKIISSLIEEYEKTSGEKIGELIHEEIVHNDDDDDSSASLPLPVSLPVEQLMAPGGLFGPSSRTSAALSSTLSGSSSASLLPARFRSAPPLRLLPLTDFKSMAPRAKFSSSPLDASPSTSASAFNPSINPSTLNPSINPSAFNPSINPSNFSPSIRPPNQSPSMPPPTLNPSLPPPAPNPSIPSPNSNPSASQFNSSSNFNHSTTPSTDHFTLSSASNPPDSSIHPSNASFSSFSPSSSLLISSSAAAAAKSPSTGQFEPSLPLCIVTFDRTELLAYAKRFADPLRRCPVTNSCVVRFVPLRTPKAPDSENAFCVKREEIQLNGLPLAELIGMDGQTAGFLVPVTKKLSQVPSAVLLPEISNATNCIFYSVNIPLKTGEPT